MAPIQIQRLVKRYGPVTAVDNLSFEVQPGTITGFLGPNGAGKTTTLRMLLGLVTPDAGSATINGRRYTELAEPLHQVGAVLEAGFHPGRTARAQLRIQALSADADPSRADDVVRLFRASAGCAACCAASRTRAAPVLVSSHMLAEVAQTIDSAVIVHDGRLVVQAPVAELTAGGTDLETAFFHLTREAAR